MFLPGPNTVLFCLNLDYLLKKFKVFSAMVILLYLLNYLTFVSFFYFKGFDAKEEE